MPLLGPTIEGTIYEAPQVIKVYAASASSKIGGGKLSGYDANRLNNIRTNEGVTKMGAVVGTYDPEWNAWLAGEL